MILALVAEALVYRFADLLTALAPMAGLTLAAVFVLAAVTKLIDQPNTAREFEALGLPAPSVLARIVPPAELLVAALVVFRPTIGGSLAILTLLGFSAVLAAALRDGRSVSCGCLGALSRGPVSVTTLTRNGVLVALAALVSIGPTPAGLSPALPAIEVALAAGTVAILAAIGHQLLALRNQIGRLWSVDLAGEGGNGRRSHRRQADRTHTERGETDEEHAERAVMNGAVS